jgi:hypothetical protein
MGSRASSVSIVMGWTAGVQLSAGARGLSLLHSVKTGSEAHPASYWTGTWALWMGVKRPGREADNSPPSSAEVRNGGPAPPLPPKRLWHSAGLIKHRDNVTFSFYPRLEDRGCKNMLPEQDLDTTRSAVIRAWSNGGAISDQPLSTSYESRNTVTRLVTVDGYWIDNWIYRTLQPITTDYLNSTTTNSVGSILDLQLSLLAPFSISLLLLHGSRYIAWDPTP